MRDFNEWDAPLARSGSSMAPATALVVITDPRLAVSVTLVLQEMGFAVDQGADPSHALRWLRRARHDLVIATAVEIGLAEYLIRLRYAASDARIVLLAEPSDVPDGVEELHIHVMSPALDVNTLVAFLR